MPHIPRIQVQGSAIHGQGVFAASDLAAGEVVLEYQGQLISHAEADARYGDDGASGHTFLFTLNEHYVVDGNRNGNPARWINHSCEPNCQAYIEESADGLPQHDRIMIETLRAIAVREELTYDYGIVLAVAHSARMKKRWPCYCGSSTCSGSLLKPKRRRAAVKLDVRQ